MRLSFHIFIHSFVAFFSSQIF